MLITVYQKKHNKFIPVDQYYFWRVELVRETEEPLEAYIPCPGCSKNMPRQRIRFHHQCNGATTDYPIDYEKFKYNRQWDPKKRTTGPYTVEELDHLIASKETHAPIDHRIEEYLASRTHQTIIGE